MQAKHPIPPIPSLVLAHAGTHPPSTTCHSERSGVEESLCPYDSLTPNARHPKDANPPFLPYNSPKILNHGRSLMAKFLNTTGVSYRLEEIIDREPTRKL